MFDDSDAEEISSFFGSNLWHDEFVLVSSGGCPRSLWLNSEELGIINIIKFKSHLVDFDEVSSDSSVFKCS